jgi:large subunit ribosomal protein L18
MDRKNWIKKKTRLKNKLRKSNSMHRLIVFRSNKHIYGQVLDVEKGTIVLSSSSNDTEITKGIRLDKSNKTEASKIVAKTLSDKMKKNKITSITFDRNGYIYHGRIKAFAEELRENGINF